MALHHPSHTPQTMVYSSRSNSSFSCNACDQTGNIEECDEIHTCAASKEAEGHYKRAKMMTTTTTTTTTYKHNEESSTLSRCIQAQK
jgi:hypothetical protein